MPSTPPPRTILLFSTSNLQNVCRPTYMLIILLQWCSCGIIFYTVCYVSRWEWSREPHSLAGANIIGNTTEPRLLLTDLLAGSYSFQLQVSRVSSRGFSLTVADRILSWSW
jgi:hypothetical protein